MLYYVRLRYSFYKLFVYIKLYFVPAKFLDREPFFGEIVGFRSRKNGNYARGRIHKYIGDNTYCVKHMDYPYKENIEFSEMIELQFDQKTVCISIIISCFYELNK